MTRLDPKATRRAMRLSVGEALAFAVMLGWGEAFFIADGVRLGASPLQIGLLVALPLCLGALGPFAVLGVLSRWKRRRPVAILGASGQAAILFALAICEASHLVAPWVLIGLVSVYQAFGQGTGVAWASWYGDVVPRGIRGRYFSRRARWAHLGTFASVILAGLVLQEMEPGAPGDIAAAAGGSGYVLIFAIAAGARLVCCFLLAAAPEADFEGIASGREALRLVRSEGGRSVRRVFLAAFALMLMVYTASPYFGPFMLQELRFSYVSYTIASTVVVVMKWATLPAWGRPIDSHGARSAYVLAAFLIGLVPLPWIFARGIALVIVGQCLSGFVWGGHEVAYFSLLLETASSRIRPALFAVANALNGGAQLLGSLLGGVLLEGSGASFRTVFAASMFARILVAIGLPRLLPREVGRPAIGRRGLLLRILGFRPSGGLVQRPLPMDGRAEADAGAPGTGMR